MAEPLLQEDLAHLRAVRFRTSAGSLVMTPNWETSPRAVNAFTSLARQGFYNGLTFHRLVPGFIIQGGDPLSSGAGNAGFSFVGEKPQMADYRKGAVAMAVTDGGMCGSQFFFCLADQSRNLAAEYPLLGTITEGFDVIDRLNEWETTGNDEPNPEITIEAIEVDLVLSKSL